MSEEDQENTQEEPEVIENEFALNYKEEEITLVGNDGERVEFILREIRGDKRDAYLNKTRPKLGIDGSSVRDFTNIQTDLICITMLYANEKNEKGGDKFVTAAFVNALPASTVNKLFKRCATISALDEEAEKVAKKS